MTADIEMINIQDIERRLRDGIAQESDVKYRFVIDMASLAAG